ncbi:MAG TPA: SCO family protein, partial [Gemmata sp.]|nr:SCO family protein [Gemmata sp.]
SIRYTLLTATLGLGLLAALPVPAAASGSDGLVPVGNVKTANDRVLIVPNVGGEVPLDVQFHDEQDQPITLRKCIDGKVTIFVPMYYRCPKLCNIVLSELVETLRKMPVNYNVGKEFNVVCLSFDPKERNSRVADKSLAAEKKANTVATYGRPGAAAGWHFLTGDVESIKSCMEALGYKYEYDRFLKEYNHPSGLVILTPEGKISRYFYGINFDSPRQLKNSNAEPDAKDLLPGEVIPKGTTTLRLSLVEASHGKLGSLLDQVTLLCSSYEYGKGYSVMSAVRIGGLITLVSIGTLVGFSILRERRRNRLQNPPDTAPPIEGRI